MLIEIQKLKHAVNLWLIVCILSHEKLRPLFDDTDLCISSRWKHTRNQPKHPQMQTTSMFSQKRHTMHQKFLASFSESSSLLKFLTFFLFDCTFEFSEGGIERGSGGREGGCDERGGKGERGEETMFRNLAGLLLSLWLLNFLNSRPDVCDAIVHWRSQIVNEIMRGGRGRGRAVIYWRHTKQRGSSQDVDMDNLCVLTVTVLYAKLKRYHVSSFASWWISLITRTQAVLLNNPKRRECKIARCPPRKKKKNRN